MAQLAAAATALWAILPAAAQLSSTQILSRVSEEAEVLQQNAPKVLTTELLQQRAVLPPSRFQPRSGTIAPDRPATRLRIREVLSEYSFGTLANTEPKSLIEYRQVLSVDGRAVQTPENARKALLASVQKGDDRSRKRMLEEFAKSGLVDIATDYGLILLMFTRRSLDDLLVTPLGAGWLGAEPVLTYSWQQKSSASGALEFHGKESNRRALRGTLWVRASDGLPMRVSAWLEHVDGARQTIRDEGTVDYQLSAHGFLTPASVLHRHMVNAETTTENLFSYEPFKLFTASSEIKFTDLPPAGTTPPPPVKK